MKNYSFKPGWIPSICVIVLFPLFLLLGAWQLHRADEKKALMALREQHQNEPPIALTGEGLTLEGNRYRRVVVAGEYDVGHQFLLDNQIFKQQAGYHVLTPLRINGSSLTVLVNRGWIPAGRDRTRRPDLAITQTKVRIGGFVDRFPGVGFKLKGSEIPSPGWPALVQLADSERLSGRLGYRLLPYQVLLDANEGEGYERAWQPPSLLPETNQGYALQWFSFALVLVFLYVWYGYERKRPE
ncbi:MAG TPA: SURF1 family protein [Methylococcaceae bacterium]|nr:SURF1 family protein [Methylococcaceae bacterium]